MSVGPTIDHTDNLNLINNAADAMRNIKGDKIIEVRSFLDDDDWINIRICDSGPGIPAYLKNEIFEPYYTTKDGGTGIGLSISHRIVFDHGGTLEVIESKWGGAEFVIRLPIEKGVGQK